MSNRANAGNLHIKEPKRTATGDELYAALDDVGDQLTAVDQRLNELSNERIHALAREAVAKELTELQEMRASLEADKAALRALDAQQEPGEKRFTSGDPVKDVSLRNFGRVVTAARRAAMGDRNLGEAYTRAQTEGTDTAGGIGVPTEWYPGIAAVLSEASLPRGLCTVIPMKRDKIVVPIHSHGNDTGGAGSDGGAEILGEGTAATEINLVFKNTASSTLDTSVVAAYDSMSRQLDEDEFVGMEAFVGKKLAEKIAIKENYEYLVGGTFTGVIGLSGIGSTQMASTKVAFSDATYDNFADTEANISDDLVGEGVWIFKKTGWRYAHHLRDTTGQPLWSLGVNVTPQASPHVVGGSPVPKLRKPGYFFGASAYVSGQMPASAANKVMAIYGVPEYTYFGDRQDIKVEWNPHILWNKLLNAVMVHTRIGILHSFPAAYSVLKTAAS